MYKEKRIVQNVGENPSWFSASFTPDEWSTIIRFITLAEAAGDLTDYSYVSKFSFEEDEDFFEPKVIHKESKLDEYINRGAK